MRIAPIRPGGNVASYFPGRVSITSSAPPDAAASATRSFTIPRDVHVHDEHDSLVAPSGPGSIWGADGISVIEVHGKDDLRISDALFRALGVPCHVVFDGDLGMEDRTGEAVRTSFLSSARRRSGRSSARRGRTGPRTRIFCSTCERRRLHSPPTTRPAATPSSRTLWRPASTSTGRPGRSGGRNSSAPARALTARTRRRTWRQPGPSPRSRPSCCMLCWRTSGRWQHGASRLVEWPAALYAPRLTDDAAVTLRP